MRMLIINDKAFEIALLRSHMCLIKKNNLNEWFLYVDVYFKLNTVPVCLRDYEMIRSIKGERLYDIYDYAQPFLITP